MRTFFTISLLLVQLIVMGQDDAGYYDPHYNQVLPRQIGASSYPSRTPSVKFAESGIDNRWYVGIDGFARSEKNTLSNTFDGLVGTHAGGGYAWGGVLGWVGHENWGVEAEYARAPIHNVLIINGDNPLEYSFPNEKSTIMLRGKRRMMFNKTDLRRSAFWISAGFGIVPNSGKRTDYTKLVGSRQRGRGQRDTLALISDTRTNEHITGLAEISAEYVLKAAKSLDIAFFLRRQWGIGTSLTTNLDYYVNGKKSETATITGDGSGWKLGVSLRYVFQIGYDSENIGRTPD